jgi:hypothetical protein
MNAFKSQRVKLKARRTFLKKGTCSRTFVYLLNREFGHPVDEEEKALDPMAGGILQQGYQCGMLWGASMAIGAEAFRRNKNPGQANALAIQLTQLLIDSFVHRAKSIECEDITQCDFSNKKGLLKFMLSGKFVSCFRLAGKWAPEALEAARRGLEQDSSDLPEQSLSCASEVISRMGGSEKEMIMVSGFAGGLGLSGSGCGALAAVIWKNALVRNKKQDKKSASFDPANDTSLMTFYEHTDYEMQCEKICGKRFNTLDEHTAYLNKGGCSKLIEVLAATGR